MKLIEATLPLLGSNRLFFYRESEVVLNFFGDKELRRLDRILHLGVASRVFTGVNHTRLEYMLLQCAAVQMVAKLHKDDADVSLSNVVYLDGLTKPVSSGEELLKIWSLLAAVGHTQWTYGVERSMLQFAVQHNKFRREFLSDIPFPDLKHELESIIESYDDRKFHFVIAVRRILSPENKHKREKRILLQYIRHLLVPLDKLHTDDNDKQYKIRRLRRLYDRIRLLSIIGIDSHHSHIPLKFHLHSALSDVENLKTSFVGSNDTHERFNALASWAADALYLNPEVTKYQRGYELMALAKLRMQYAEVLKGKNDFHGMLRNILNAGFGQPRSADWVHLMRITTKDEMKSQLLGGMKTNYDRLIWIGREMNISDKTMVSVDKNSHVGFVYVDLFYHKIADSNEIDRMLKKSVEWMFRQLDAGARRMIREISADVPAQEEFMTRIRRGVITRQIGRHPEIIFDIYKSILKYIIPEKWELKILNFLPRTGSDRPVYFKYKYDDISDSTIGKLKPADTYGYSIERQMEVRATGNIFSKTEGLLVFVCFDKMILSDEYGKSQDEWDGLIIAIDDLGVRIRIIEAKSVSGRKVREEEAFNQLKKTIQLLHKKGTFHYRRRRIDGVGAELDMRLSSY